MLRSSIGELEDSDSESRVGSNLTHKQNNGIVGSPSRFFNNLVDPLTAPSADGGRNSGGGLSPVRNCGNELSANDAGASSNEWATSDLESSYVARVPGCLTTIQEALEASSSSDASGSHGVLEPSNDVDSGVVVATTDDDAGNSSAVSGSAAMGGGATTDGAATDGAVEGFSQEGDSDETSQEYHIDVSSSDSGGSAESSDGTSNANSPEPDDDGNSEDACTPASGLREAGADDGSLEQHKSSNIGTDSSSNQSASAVHSLGDVLAAISVILPLFVFNRFSYCLFCFFFARRV